MSNILILGRKMIFSGFRSQLSGFRFQVSPPVTIVTPYPRQRAVRRTRHAVAVPATKGVRNQNNSENLMLQIPSQASSYPTALGQVMQPPDFGPAPQKPSFLEIHEKASLSFIVNIGIVYSFFQSFRSELQTGRATSHYFLNCPRLSTLVSRLASPLSP
jgi:hypothetical protein